MAGMNSKKLSARTKQPGHDRNFLVSESKFVNAARSCLDSTIYEVIEKPKDLRNLFPATEDGHRDLGIELEALILNKQTNKRLYVEVKAQGKAGNADERACKHHTVQFYKTLHNRFGYDYHPVITIFCEELATLPRYTRKAPYFFEDGHYFNWINYEQAILCEYLKSRCQEWLES